jgi:hypothetical protein
MQPSASRIAEPLIRAALNDPREPLGPVGAGQCKKTHASGSDLKSVSIVFYFVRPTVRCRRSIDALRQTRVNERDRRAGRPFTLGNTPL